MGLLSQRGAWNGPSGFGRPDAIGPDLIYVQQTKEIVMKLLMNKKAFKIVSMIIITVLLSNCYMLPALAAGIQRNNNQERLIQFTLDVTGGCTAEQILSLIQKAYPLSDEQAAELLLAIDKLLTPAPATGSDIEPAQSAACASAAFLFITGLSLVVLSMLLSETLTQEECVEETCIGDFCICEQKEVTTPLSGVNLVLRSAGTLMMLFGVIGSFTCLLNTGAADTGVPE